MQNFTVPDSDRISPGPSSGPRPRIRQLTPPAPKEPGVGKTNYRVLSPQEIKRFGLPGGSYSMSSEGKIDKIADAPKIPEDQQASFREPIDKIMGVIDAAANSHRMTRQGGLAGNSVGRVIGAPIPGTATRDIAGYLDTIGGNTAFETLQQMRQQSPTGGAVGNVSDADMKLLRSTIASLDPGQSTEKFQRDLSTVLKSYQKVLYKLPGGKEAFHNWRQEWLGKGKKAAAPQPQSSGWGAAEVVGH